MTHAGATAGLVAFAFTALSVPLIIRLSARWSLFDPIGPLKIHARPTSRLGGIAIAGSLAVAQWIIHPHSSSRNAPILAAGAILFAVGLADDLWGLSPYLRLAIQVLAASILPLAGWRLPIVSQHALNVPVTVLFLLVFVNGFNAYDGSDGLASGVAAIVAAAYALLPGTAPATDSATIAWSVAGACVAFLWFNFPPSANIFLGDSGSTLLGFALASLALDSTDSRSPNRAHLLFLCFAAALPLLDLAFAVIRRTLSGRSALVGDRRHICDLLLVRGWTPRRVALGCYAVTAGLSMVGWLSVRVGAEGFMAISALTLGALACAGSRLGALRMSGERPAKIARGKLPWNREERNPV